MAASTATYIGNVRGILGLDDNSITGLVIDDISFSNKTQEHEYLDINGDVTSCGYDKHEIDISLNARLLSGTAFSNKVASALTLTTVKNALPTGYGTGGTTIIYSIKFDQKISDYQKLSIDARHYPKVV